MQNLPTFPFELREKLSSYCIETFGEDISQSVDSFIEHVNPCPETQDPVAKMAEAIGVTRDDVFFIVYQNDREGLKSEVGVKVPLATVRVRSYRPEDDIKELEDMFDHEVVGYQKPRQKELDFDDFRCIAKGPRGEALGFVQYVLTNGFCIVDKLYVDPKYRGNGIGLLLIDSIVETALRENAEGVVVFAPKDAGKFYRKIGFYPIAEHISNEETQREFDGYILPLTERTATDMHENYGIDINVVGADPGKNPYLEPLERKLKEYYQNNVFIPLNIATCMR